MVSLYRQVLPAASPVHPCSYGLATAQELMVAAFEHLEGDGHQPYAFGHCTECGRLIIGWSAYQWPIVVQEPCPKCGKPW